MNRHLLMTLDLGLEGFVNFQWFGMMDFDRWNYLNWLDGLWDADAERRI